MVASVAALLQASGAPGRVADQSLPMEQNQFHALMACATVNVLLFDVGKLAIGLYIGKQGLKSTYGAAASIVIVLIWVYYSAQIVLMGAEFTHVNAVRRGSLRVGRETPKTTNSMTDPVGALARAPFLTVIGALCLGLYMGFVGLRSENSRPVA